MTPVLQQKLRGVYRLASQSAIGLMLGQSPPWSLRCHQIIAGPAERPPDWPANPSTTRDKAAADEADAFLASLQSPVKPHATEDSAALLSLAQAVEEAKQAHSTKQSKQPLAGGSRSEVRC